MLTQGMADNGGPLLVVYQLLTTGAQNIEEHGIDRRAVGLVLVFRKLHQICERKDTFHYLGPLLVVRKVNGMY